MIIFFYLRVLINIIYDKIHPVDMSKYNRLIRGQTKESVYLPRTRVIVGFDEENNLYRTFLPPPSTGTLSKSFDRDAHGKKIKDFEEGDSQWI